MMLRTLKNYASLASDRARNWGHRAVLMQLAEMSYLLMRQRIGPGYYLMAEMGHRSREWRYKRGFMNYSRYLHRVNELNDPLYQRCSQNKLVEKAILTAYGLRTPRLYGHFEPSRGFATDGLPLRTADDLCRLLGTQPRGARVCFKPVDSWGGQGFRAIEWLGQNRVKDLADARELTVTQFTTGLHRSEGGGMVVERYIEQDARYAEFNASSVNTIRVMVCQRDEEDPRCFGAFLRIGRSGSLVDNGMAGGIMVRVHPESGVLSAGQFSSVSNERFKHHPDSGATLEGAIVPCFEEAKQLACEALRAFPRIRYAGFDIAFAQDGPVVIEMNVQPDYVDFALIQVPTKHALY